MKTKELVEIDDLEPQDDLQLLEDNKLSDNL